MGIRAVIVLIISVALLAGSGATAFEENIGGKE